MLIQALQFLIETAFGLFSLSLLLRFVLQAVRAPSRNPLSAFLIALTDWAVRPTRRFIPGLWGLDLSTLVLAWATEWAMLLLVFLLRGNSMESAPLLVLVVFALLAAVQVLKLAVYVVMVATVIQALLSWVAPGSPVAPLLDALTRPFLRVFRRRIPPVGNVDLSPLFVLVGCQLMLMLPVAWLESSVSRLF
jgi:YggT family protein